MQPNKPVKEDSIGHSKANHLSSTNVNEAAASRFEAHMNHKPFELRFRSIFSELDVGTNQKEVWDIWIKFPMKIPKDQCQLFGVKVNQLFQDMFLERGKP